MAEPRAARSVSTPGRVCLLGEHQDYFGLSVITAAFDRILTISAAPIDEPVFQVELLNYGESLRIPLSGESPYESSRDYLRSARNVLARRGYRWTQGYRCEIRSTIPTGKGVSTSSALCVAWVKMLLALADPPASLSPAEVAELAYQTEVAEFGEPGGKMDHYATSLGGVLYVDCTDPPYVLSFKKKISGLVLADSLTTKDTTGVLASIKSDVNRALAEVRLQWPQFDLRKTPLPQVLDRVHLTDAPHHRRLVATLESRDLVRDGLFLLRREGELDALAFGRLMNAHHESIRDRLGVSTRRIDELREAALAAGALGGKIVGSGAGGCAVFLAPGREAEVIAAVERAGGEAFALNVHGGATLE